MSYLRESDADLHGADGSHRFQAPVGVDQAAWRERVIAHLDAHMPGRSWGPMPSPAWGPVPESVTVTYVLAELDPAATLGPERDHASESDLRLVASATSGGLIPDPDDEFAEIDTTEADFDRMAAGGVPVEVEPDAG